MDDDASVVQFYDHLAGDYHLIFADWEQGVRRQGDVLDALLRRHLGPGPLSVLDCSCGIGTQAIGLALHGHTVHGTDLSPAAVERAQQEARRFGVSCTFGVADLRTLDTQVGGTFDAVISCDNAVPHLLSREDLQLAARSMQTRVRADGLLLVSIRDYDQIVSTRPRATMPRVLDGGDGKRIVFQVWDWHDDGLTYTLDQFILRREHQEQNAWKAACYTTRYRALLRDELTQILSDAGFSQITWLMPEESGYYQPIVTAYNRARTTVAAVDKGA